MVGGNGHSIRSLSFSHIEARGLARLMTELLKHKIGTRSLKIIFRAVNVFIGRLRPDFLARCQWDEVVQGCTGYHFYLHSYLQFHNILTALKTPY